MAADDDPRGDLSSSDIASNSASVAVWTIVSRVTGFARVVVVAAVLGPTFVGNVYLAATLLPQLALELATGALLQTVFLPGLVRIVDRGDRRTSERFAGGFLGSVMVPFVGVAVLATILAPLLLAIFVLGVQDPAVADDQRRVGWLLIALTMPQVPLLGLAFISTSVMNAHGRFALGAAAPVVENAGVVATMLLSVAIYGAGPDISTITTGHVLLLGGGTTLAVALHAGLQWWGAWRSGLLLVPRAGWRDPEVRPLLRRSRTALGQAALTSGRQFAALAVANSVAGGVVAFRLAVNFFWLPIMVGARPVAVAFQPLLARLHHRGDERQFHADYLRGLGLVLFLTIPAGVAYAVLGEPLAQAASFGEMADQNGARLVAVALAALGVGVVGESAFMLATHAAYARDDARSPFRATVAGTVLSLAGMGVALALPGDRAVLLALGASMSAGAVLSAAWLMRSLAAEMPDAPSGIRGALVRGVGASAAMAVPAYAVAALLAPDGAGGLAAIVPVVAALAVGAAVFLAVQRAAGAPELAFFRGGLRGGG